VHNQGAASTTTTSYTRVRAVVWAYGRGQTDIQIDTNTDTQTRVTIIHFASSTTHAKCNYEIASYLANQIVRKTCSCVSCNLYAPRLRAVRTSWYEDRRGNVCLMEVPNSVRPIEFKAVIADRREVVHNSGSSSRFPESSGRAEKAVKTGARVQRCCSTGKYGTPSEQLGVSPASALPDKTGKHVNCIFNSNAVLVHCQSSTSRCSISSVLFDS